MWGLIKLVVMTASPELRTLLLLQLPLVCSAAAAAAAHFFCYVLQWWLHQLSAGWPLLS
jgi:hypothetical protein